MFFRSFSSAFLLLLLSFLSCFFAGVSLPVHPREKIGERRSVPARPDTSQGEGEEGGEGEGGEESLLFLLSSQSTFGVREVRKSQKKRKTKTSLPHPRISFYMGGGVSPWPRDDHAHRTHS